MKINLAYGKTGLEVELPNNLQVDVITPRYVEPQKDPFQAVRNGLQNPIGCRALSEQVKPEDKVGIIFNDITRATPYDVIMPVLLEQLAHVPSKNITLFNATGTHRQNTETELRVMLGDECVDRYKIIQNDADDIDSHITVGITKSGNEIRVLKHYVECDVRILTGFIEPHFFAGFSGGPKACVPGLAELSTVLKNHSAINIDSPNATWGVTYGNPLWEELYEAANLAGEAFLINVAMNRDKQITAVFAGQLEKAHKTGCKYVKETAMVSVKQPYDIVITSNAGCPLDLNMYQAVKGMSAAARIIKSGGAIIVAADCWDGFPEHGLYKQLLTESASPTDLLNTIHQPGFSARDTWQAQIHAHICQKGTIFFYSDHLSDEQIQSAFMTPCRDIPACVQSIAGKTKTLPTICVLPEGPLTIPYLRV